MKVTHDITSSYTSYFFAVYKRMKLEQEYQFIYMLRAIVEERIHSKTQMYKRIRSRILTLRNFSVNFRLNTDDTLHGNYTANHSIGVPSPKSRSLDGAFVGDSVTNRTSLISRSAGVGSSIHRYRQKISEYAAADEQRASLNYPNARSKKSSLSRGGTPWDALGPLDEINLTGETLQRIETDLARLEQEIASTVAEENKHLPPGMTPSPGISLRRTLPVGHFRPSAGQSASNGMVSQYTPKGSETDEEAAFALDHTDLIKPLGSQHGNALLAEYIDSLSSAALPGDSRRIGVGCEEPASHSAHSSVGMSDQAAAQRADAILRSRETARKGRSQTHALGSGAVDVAGKQSDGAAIVSKSSNAALGNRLRQQTGNDETLRSGGIRSGQENNPADRERQRNLLGGTYPVTGTAVSASMPNSAVTFDAGNYEKTHYDINHPAQNSPFVNSLLKLNQGIKKFEPGNLAGNESAGREDRSLIQITNQKLDKLIAYSLEILRKSKTLAAKLDDDGKKPTFRDFLHLIGFTVPTPSNRLEMLLLRLLIRELYFCYLLHLYISAKVRMEQAIKARVSGRAADIRRENYLHANEQKQSTKPRISLLRRG